VGENCESAQILHYISETTPDRAIIERQLQVIGGLLNGVIFNNLE